MSTTVLVIEDDLEINELLGEYLALEKIDYLQAATGEEGIKIAQARRPDAIILDLMLPDIDGFTVANTLTNHRITYDIPIIILSCMCQQCDRERGYSAGALFYMNKPFLPDDLLSTLRRALEWRNNLSLRPPQGTITLGCKDLIDCSKAAHQMVADLFARTNFSDALVTQIHDVINTLSQWSRQWNTTHHSDTQLRLDYKVNPIAASLGEVEWTLSENAPGMLADAFFKPIASGTGGGLMGWGGSTLVAKPAAPIAPPSAWLQVLAQTGAARFEKDSESHTVRFARTVSSEPPAAGTAAVPVVEIDGARYPTRVRNEALAAKRK